MFINIFLKKENWLNIARFEFNCLINLAVIQNGSVRPIV